MREIEAEFPQANIEADRAVEEISRQFGLPLLSRGFTQVRDIYVDTENHYLLRHNLSLRVRRKLDNVYAGEGIRLTFKYPLEEHPDLFIREELKLKVSVFDFDRLVEFFGGLTHALLGEPAHMRLAVEETSKEFNLGEEGCVLNVSYDRVKFKHPHHPQKVHQVNYFELEDHGIGIDRLLEIKDFVRERYGLSTSTESTYRYGLRALSLLPREGVLQDSRARQNGRGGRS